MITKITDERLQAIIESTPEYETYLLSALNELVSLRSQKKALVEDGERLAMRELFGDLKLWRWMDSYEYDDEVGNIAHFLRAFLDARKQHTALLKDLSE